MIVKLIEKTYSLLWGDLFAISLGNSSIGISLMILLLVPAGIYFTIRTGFLPIRYFPQMIGTLRGKKEQKTVFLFSDPDLSTATRVGMGNLVLVWLPAVSAGGAGAVFWMWLMALLGASTAYVEASLAQKYKAPDPLYGGYRGGPAYYIHEFLKEKTGKNRRRFLIPSLFAISGLICWCGISQVISNSVSSAFQNAFHIPPIVTTVILVFLAAVIVLQKNATIKLLDILVPIMAGSFFAITVFIILLNVRQLPAVFARIFSEAFGLRQAVSGGLGAVIMNGIKRGLFSNEAGSGSAPCASAAAEGNDPSRTGLIQALGVLIDTIGDLQLHCHDHAAGSG